MAKFAYRMQSILDIRETLAGQAQIALGVGGRRRMEAQGDLD